MYAQAALAAYSIISGMQQAELVRENARISKELSDFNSDLAELDAYNAEKDGYTKEARYQTAINQTIGSQRVAMASQGVDVSFGTAAAIQQETKLKGYLNQQDLLNEANNRAMGYKTEARNIRLQGYLGGLQSEVSASSIERAGIINAAKIGVSGYSGSATA